MTVNDALIRQNFLQKLLLNDGNETLSSNLKVKVMKMRIEFNKVRKDFDADLQEFSKTNIPDRFNELKDKGNDRTEEENAEFNQIIADLNADFIKYVEERNKDEVKLNTTKFTEEEYEELVKVNSSNDIDLNGNKFTAGDFLEAIYELFVA